MSIEAMVYVFSSSSIYLNGQYSSNTFRLCFFQGSKIQCLSARVEEMPLCAWNLASYWTFENIQVQVPFLQRLTFTLPFLPWIFFIFKSKSQLVLTLPSWLS